MDSNDLIFVNGFPIPTRQARKNTVAGVILFCFALILYIVLSGDKTNTLHTSALAWAFSLSGAVIGAYIFGAVWDNSNVMANYKAAADVSKSLS